MNFILGLAYRFLYPKFAASIDSTIQRVLLNPKTTGWGLGITASLEGFVTYLNSVGCHVSQIEVAGGMLPAVIGAYMTEKNKVIVTNGSGRPETKQILPDGTAVPVTTAKEAWQGVDFSRPEGSN